MKKKICIVIANYYPSISKDLIEGAVRILKKNGIKSYKKIIVPGIYEIPVVISKKINSYDGFIALGCVIKGKTPHFEFISRSVINGLLRLSMMNKKPIGNGIITCLNKKQAIIRSNINKKDKGGEAAKAIISILKI
jgi:6,7-dimethyl-8-ribityllumazine synthase